MAKESQTLGLEAIRARLRQCGLRATPARIATYEVLHRAAAPLAHADVVAALAGRGLDRATIYRNLIDLTEVGLLARTDLGDHTWRFELEGEHGGSHPHFICVDCGEVSCLEGLDVELRGEQGLPRSVASEDVEVQLRGRCDACS